MIVVGGGEGGLLAAAPFRQGTCSPAHSPACLFPSPKESAGSPEESELAALENQSLSSGKRPAMGVHSLASHLGEPLHAI